MIAKEILANLVSIPSVSGSEAGMARWIGSFLEKSGFVVEYQEVERGRPNVFAVKGSPRLLFFGHMDTVAPLGGWSKDPFSFTAEGDRGYGLGTWDMKGGLSCILDAAQTASDMAVLFTVDEEEISKGSWKALGKTEFFSPIRGIISAEAGNAPGTYGGARHLSFGRQGRLAYRLLRKLSAGHAATANEDWVEWIYAKSRMPKVKSRIVIRNFHATSKGLSMPDEAELDIDVLIHPEEKDLDFASLLQSHFEARPELKKRETPYLKPYSFEGHPFIAEVASIIEKEYGKPSLQIGSSVGDENALANLGIPIAIVGPEGRNEHRADEWVSLKSLDEVAALYKKFLSEL